MNLNPEPPEVMGFRTFGFRVQVTRRHRFPYSFPLRAAPRACAPILSASPPPKKKYYPECQIMAASQPPRRRSCSTLLSPGRSVLAASDLRSCFLATWKMIDLRSEGQHNPVPRSCRFAAPTSDVLWHHEFIGKSPRQKKGEGGHSPIPSSMSTVRPGWVTHVERDPKSAKTKPS